MKKNNLKIGFICGACVAIILHTLYRINIIAILPFTREFFDLRYIIIYLPYPFQLKIAFVLTLLVCLYKEFIMSIKKYPAIGILYILNMILILGSQHEGLHLIPYAILASLPLVTGRYPYRLENPSKIGDGFLLKGEIDDLPINKPEEGIYVLGGPGSGKTRYVIEPLIQEVIQQGRGGLIHDYDFSLNTGERDRSLTTFAYNVWKQSKRQGLDFYTINFSDPQYSHRINPVDAHIISDRGTLRQIVHTFIYNLSKGNAKDGFWVQAAISLFESVLMFLSNQYPNFCTLPHAITFICAPADNVLQTIKSDQEAYAKSCSIIESAKEAPETFRGILTNLQTKLSGLMEEKVFYVLSHNTVPVNITSHKSRSIVCLGNVPTKTNTYSPLIAVVMTTLFKGMYKHEEGKAFIVIDELPTLYLPSLPEVPATARKYGVATAVALQSNAQLEEAYGSQKADALRENLKNKLISACEDNSALYASRLMGKKEVEKKGKQDIFTPQDISSLKVGEFVGKVVGSNKTYFHTKLKPASCEVKEELPMVDKNVSLKKTKEKILADINRVLL